MRLEGTRPNCCSSRRLLTLDGRPWGEVVGRAFGESCEVRITGRGRYHLVKKGSWKSRFDLQEGETGEVLASVESGAFEKGWRILLPGGVGCVLQPDGVFKQGFTAFDETGARIAKVSVRGACSDDIIATADGAIDPLDLLVLLLVYNIVATRRAAAAAS
ncbi:MAG: hypothetical protein ACF8QF_14005 [Phycisphaerales bacterium]